MNNNGPQVSVYRILYTVIEGPGAVAELHITDWAQRYHIQL